MEHLGGRRGGGDLHPLGGLARRPVQDGRHLGVTVQARGQHVVETGRLDLVEVGLADEAPVGDEGDPPDTEAPLVVGHDDPERGRVAGVAGEHVVGDGDAVAGHEEPDHDLGPITALVPAVAVVARREVLARAGRRLEVGGGEVVEGEAQVEVGEIGQARVQRLLGLLLGVAQGVEGAVAAVEGGELHVIGQLDRLGPLEDRAPLGGRVAQAVGHHDEHGVGQVDRAALVTDAPEVVAQPDLVEVRRHRRHRPERRGAGPLQRRGLQPLALGVLGEGLDDAVQLSAALELTDLAQAQQLHLAVLPLDAHRFDERQVGVLLVATSPDRALHVHS